MNDWWTPRTASSIDAPEARVRPTSWDDAQEWCNFVLLRPAGLPSGWETEQPMLRAEAPPGRLDSDRQGRSPWTTHNRSSCRCVGATASGRVRMKQFLYDWAPPAFDHPALWRSSVRSFMVGARVGWLGTDYVGRAAASLHAHRTMVELSVVSGHVADEDLVRLCAALAPVTDVALRRIDATPLAVLSYAHRHEDTVITVPVGYFFHRRSPQTLRLRALTPPDVPTGLRGGDVVGRLASCWSVDSVFLVGDPDAPLEVDWVLRQRAKDTDTTIRILATAADADGSIALPPRLAEQPCTSERLQVHGVRVDHAWADSRVGPHEAAWRENDTALMLLARPQADTDVAWFRALLAEAVASRP